MENYIAVKNESIATRINMGKSQKYNVASKKQLAKAPTV